MRINNPLRQPMRLAHMGATRGQSISFCLSRHMPEHLDPGSRFLGETFLPLLITGHELENEQKCRTHR
jgi:hypothetical protein